MKTAFGNAVRTVLLPGLLLSSYAIALGQTPADTSTSAAPAADNTKVNQQDQQSGAPTADQQKNSPADRETTRKIRRALMKDKTLSIYAHNVKIISQNGMVTLRGPVRTEAEKQAIEAAATAVAGDNKVTNDLSITPK